MNPDLYNQTPKLDRQDTSASETPEHSISNQLPFDSVQSPSFGSPVQQSSSLRTRRMLSIIGGFLVVGIFVGVGTFMFTRSTTPTDTMNSKTSMPSTAKEIEEKTSDANESSVVVTKKVNRKVITDFGYGIALEEVVTGYVPENPDPNNAPYILKVLLTKETDQYIGGSPYVSEFVLVVDGREVESAQYYSGMSSYDLSKAGYTGLESKAITKDAPNSGYIQIGIPKNQKPTALRYKQPESRLAGSTIPAKDYDIAIE